MLERFRELAQASSVLGWDRSKEAAKLCEVAKTHLKEQLLSAVQRGSTRPALLSYQSDGTPQLTKEHHTAHAGAIRARRIGGAGRELLVQKVYVRTTSAAGVPAVVALLTDPRPLTAGKSAWCLYTAATELCPLLKDLGHASISVSHYGFDRAMYSALSRKLLQRHVLYHETRRAVDATGIAYMSELLDWPTATACCNHDVQNALKWSLQKYVDGPDGISDIYIAIESLRNGFSLLHAHLRSFVHARLDFDDAEFSVDEGVTFWNALGVDPAVANELAELNVRWSGDRLLVCAAARSSDGLIERVSTLMLALFRFQKFSDSRWCTLGAACRSLTAALCVGLRGLVAAVRADPLSSDYHIHGFERLSMQSTRYVVIAGVSMHVADSFLVDLLEDDRVARRADALRSVLVEETKWLASLDDAVWQRLAGVISNAYDGLRLRSECVDAALVCGAFITRSVLYQLEKCPWSLVMGDIDENLDALQEQARAPRELIAKKIQTLLRMDFSRDVIKEGLMLLRDVHWSTASCEQGHGSASAISRQHPNYGLAMLSQRALIHMARSLLLGHVGASGDAQIGKAARALARSKPGRISGRHVYFKEVLAVLSAPPTARLGRGNTMAVAAMRDHARRYSELPREERAVYERSAAQMRRVREHELRSEAEREDAAYALAKLRAGEEAQQRGVLLRDSTCRWTALDMLAMAVMFDSHDFSRARVEKRRAEALRAPVPPPENVRRALEQCDAGAAADGAARAPPWATTICRQRDAFASCAFLFTTHGDIKAYLFLFAKQSPMSATFAPLTLVQPTSPCLELMANEERAGMLSSFCEYEFEVEWGRFATEADILVEESTEIAVLPQCFMPEGAIVRSHCSLVAFALMNAPPDPPRGSGNPTPQVDVDLLAMYPWLAQYMKPPSDASKGRATCGDFVDVPVEAYAEPLDDAEVDAAFEALREKRLEWADLGGVADGDFVTTILGGAWTACNRGVAFDSVKAYARTKEIKAWCRRYGLQDSASYSFAAYGDELASVLSLAWCHRMQWYYNEWAAAGGGGHVFQAMDHELYKEEESFTRVAGLLAEHDPAARRAAQIRALALAAPRW